MKRTFRLSNEQLTNREQEEAQIANRVNDDWNRDYLRKKYGVPLEKTVR